MKVKLLLLALFVSFLSSGQTLIPNTTPVTQNFDGMAATLNLPTNWRMHASTAAPTWAAAATVTQQASAGTPATGGTYNFGSSASERSVGAMTSGGFASPNNLLGFFQNTNASNITALTISYDAERYRINTAAASVQFFYSLNGTTWTAVAAGDIAAASFPTGASAYNFTTGTVVNRTGISITGLNIATNSNIYLRWNINTTGGNSQGIAIDNVSVTATFAVAGFSVTYNDNASTSGTAPTDATSYASGDTVTVLGNTGTLAKTGYTFAGWNTLANGSGTNYSAGDTFSISANTTLYARWTPNNNTITFNGNGATSGSMSNQIIATAATAPLDGNGFSRVGFTFAGWATTAGGAVAYTDGASYTMGLADVTLYAVWNTIAPFITTSGTLTALSTIYGTASSNTTFTVSAGNLTNNLIITAPTGFEVSLTAGSGFATSIDLAAIDRTNTTIYVRLAANTDFGTYSGDVVAFSTILTSSNVPTVSSNVTPKPLTITGLTGDNKIYDGLTTATLIGTPTLTGVVFADDVTISGTPTSNFVDKNVGTGKAITITGYTLGGTKAANYSVSQPTGVTANITAKPLSVTAPTIASKVYNGSAVSGAVSVGTITGFVGTETVTATATGVYADANAGTGKSATVTYVLANGTNGGLATNYSLAVGTGTGDITQATPVFTTSAIAVSVGGTYTLPGANVSSTSPGALTYSITSGGFATLTGSTITGVSVGSETVTVTQAASTNYLGGSTTVGVSVTNISYPLNSFLSTTGTGVYTNTTSVWSKCGNVGGCTGTTPGSGGWDAIGASGQAPIAGSTAYIQGNITGGTTGITNLTILSGGTLTTSGNYPISGSLVVKTGGILNINSNLNFSNSTATFTVEDDADVVINSYTTNPNTSLWNGDEIFAGNSNFYYNYCRPDILLFSADNIISTNTVTGAKFGNLIIQPTIFSVASTNWTGVLPNGTYTLTRGNFVINNSSDRNFTFNGGNVTFGGDMIVNVTSTGEVATRSTAGTASFTINRNLIKNGSGMFRLNGGGDFTLNVEGDIQINSGTFRTGVAVSGTVITSVNLKGDLIAATSSLLESNNTFAGVVNFNFTGTGDGLTSATTQTIDIATTVANENRYIYFNVKPNAYVQLINRDFELGTNSRLTVETGGTFDFGFNGTTALNLMNIGTGQVFNAQSGSTVKLTSPFGITTAAASASSGNVQIPVASRFFDVGATYHYIGKANQVSGNALPLGITGKVIVELDTDALVFNASSNKTIATAGTLEIIRGIVEDTSTDSFGNLASNAGNLTMSGGRYRIFKASTQPDLSGTYNLTAGVIEFAGPLNKTIRSPKSYQNIEVTGTDVGNSSGNITLNSAGTFTVKTGGIFTINDNSIVGPTGTQTVTVENGAIFKTGDVDGFNGSTLTSIQPTIESIILANGSTVEYSRATTTGDQTITLYSPAYRNLTISGTGVKTLQDDTATRVEEDLRIDSAKLLLTINQILTVKEGVSIAATGAEFELDNNAQLIQIDEVDTNVGTNFKLKRLAFVHAQDYVYWSSPVFGFDVGLIPTQQRYFWNPINGNTNGTVGNWNGATGTDAIMPVGKGYIVNSGSGFPIRPLPAGSLETNFAGRPNNGTLTSTIQRGTNAASIDDNWNLVGNPYPSAIFAEEFLDANNTKINGSVWVWTHGQAPDNATDPYYDNFGANYYATDYLKYNKLGATDTTFNGIIASGQGFMVNMLNTTPSTSETVTFTNAMRTDATATPYNNAGFYRTANTNLTVANPEEKHRIWLSIINTAVGQKESALLGYSANATLAADHFYDCIYVPRTEVGIYTLVNTGEYVIQGRPLPFLDSDLVPMGVKIVTAGSHKIAIKKVDGLFEGNQGIYLEDTVLGIVHDLKAAPYTFTSEVGVFNSRFIVRYTPSALSNDDFDSLDNNVFVSTQSTDVSIKSANELMSSVIVYDILGRELVNKNNINANDITLPNVSAVNQALIVKITLENGQVVTRKIIL